MRSAALLLLLAACAPTGPIGRETFVVMAGTREVVFGKQFELTLVRTCAEGEPLPEWNDGSLVLRNVGTHRRADGGRVEQTDRYEAYAFALRDIDLPGFQRRVEPSLNRSEPGVVEYPGPPPARWAWWWVGGALLAVILILIARRKPSPPPPVVREPAPVASPADRARERLARLRAAMPPDEEFAREAAALVRAYVAARFRVGGDDWTTEEFLARAPAHPELLAAVCKPCDRVKFARDRFSDADKRRVLDAAASFVEKT